MCLAVPGQIISLSEAPSLERMGRVSFGGVVKEISLAFTPDARVGDYVIVHAGFAISQLDEEEAQATLAEFANLASLKNERL
ncbi:HypC/HybG/HupF family hydrogenase formation chaperone [Methylocaldum sp.]|jgi:hydrogenase expression/formation protein HypC|uniref:HypC/HybG/HupF family hydrogenase formation chaperone n=1 Tax=Methylocaldum sp. TaxID=1969727 RepID=UPI002D325396|nr:HypC/HybG/HupF family hydrogenase formation chaperone [Methylocaldum sp.]HYE37276.1 HypC/HybG/HupF family hydrogenase formation chaperone [Methylocaldum sp.]